MTTLDETDAVLADYPREAKGMVAVVLLSLLGVPFFCAGVNIALHELGSGLGLVAVSMLFNLPSILILRIYLKRKREKERVLIFADRVERRTSSGNEAFPFSALEKLEAKITTFKNSGNTYHEYRLGFGARGDVIVETESHPGVNGDTGRLLQRVSGKDVQPWR